MVDKGEDAGEYCAFVKVYLDGAVNQQPHLHDKSA